MSKAMTSDQIVRKIMRSMYPKEAGASTPKQEVLLAALRLHGLDKPIRDFVRSSGK
jgi:hypothetical protein